MGRAFGGIVRARMTRVVMIFEITGDYAVIVPLMISNLVSFFIASRLQREPIYEVLARQDGIHLPTAAPRDSEGERRVLQATRAEGETLGAETPISHAAARIRSSRITARPGDSHKEVDAVLG